MMRWILVSFLLFSTLLLSAPIIGFAQGFPQGDFTPLRETGKATFLQVIDPQTLQLDDSRIIRLTGLYFPDFSPEKPDEPTGPFTLTAIKILKDMLRGQDVTLYQTPDKTLGRVNRMGYSLAHVVRNKDGAWVQGTLVSLGLAQVQITAANPEMAAALLALEDRARTEKLGIWAETSRILTPEEAPEHIGTFQIVEGRVESAALKDNRLYLNFGKNWRDDFTVTVAPENRREFLKTGLNPLNWGGHVLRVRGWITDHNGPNIEVDTPESIQDIGESSLTSNSATIQAEAPVSKPAEKPARTLDNALPPDLHLKKQSR